MATMLLIFAFAMSVIINFGRKVIGGGEDRPDSRVSARRHEEHKQ